MEYAPAKMYGKNTFPPYTHKYISVVQIASEEASKPGHFSFVCLFVDGHQLGSRLFFAFFF